VFVSVFVSVFASVFVNVFLIRNSCDEFRRSLVLSNKVK
jgi:hypothetical protein